MNINAIKLSEGEYNEEYDVNIRPYLTHDDIISIGETALTMENLAEIDACVAYNVILATTDVKPEELDELDIDTIMYSGFWAEVASQIVNLQDVYDYIAYAQKLDVVVSKFINDVLPTMIDNLDNQLSEYLDKMSDNGVKNISDELEKIMKIVKEDDNAEIIKGALKMGGDE